jgi:Ulp1 family protease
VGGVNGGVGGTGSLSDPMAVVKYCQFPPEGAGNVSVSNEDYACLEVEQFLNDVIIDFYLK